MLEDHWNQELQVGTYFKPGERRKANVAYREVIVNSKSLFATHDSKAEMLANSLHKDNRHSNLPNRVSIA